MADFDRESMLDMFVYEMNQLIESLESTVLKAETGFGQQDINEIFRVMHTIKGSAAMMMFDPMSQTAHAIEDMFFYLREEQPANVNSEKIADVVLESMDFIKGELFKVESGMPAEGDCSDIVANIKVVLAEIKGGGASTAPAAAVVEETPVKVIGSASHGIHDFENEVNANYNTYLINFKLIESCEMKNVRAYTNISNLITALPTLTFEPENILTEEAATHIEEFGYDVKIHTEENTEFLLDNILKTSYIEKINYKKVAACDPNTDLYSLNRFQIDVKFSNGYGEDSNNIIESFMALENMSVFTICNDIVIEGNKSDDFVFEIYTASSEDDIKAKVEKFPSVTSYTISHVENSMQIEQPVVFEQETVIDSPAQSIENSEFAPVVADTNPVPAQGAAVVEKGKGTNAVISVSINKLDQLLNLMGELVIAEAMVTQNPELEELELESFHKDARQLHKIINDVQDIVMGMRMVPLSTVFFKMNRIVRDMSKQLSKDVELVVIGEETEVDKNIIEHISDPLMHMIRNSIDHGIESDDERAKEGKLQKGTVTLEAKNSGADVLIIIKDNGRGLNDKKILEKAKKNGLLKKAESEYTQKEIHQFIFQPGFSTNEVVTNYSGRGVGMDVVMSNLQMVGGSIEVHSTLGVGSEFTMKIPLTLAIIEGMIISLGGAYYTIPIISIKTQFKAKKEMISVDPSGNEMIKTSRGEILNLIRLSEFFGIESDITDIEEGIVICVENGSKAICLHVDTLVGERQVVVKSMPKYIKEIRGISGCTLLGNGDISLIIDVAGFFDK